MEKTNLVSIGIPAYNRPNGLRETLRCLTKQSYKNIEIIISDNCSPNPEVKKVALAYTKKDKRIRYYRQKKNIYVNNFLFVLQKSRGDYFMWAADDDLWESEYINKCMLELSKYKKNILVSTACKFVDPSGKKPDYIDYGFTCNNSNLANNFKLFRLIINTRRYTNSIIYGIYKKKYLLQYLPFINVLASDHLLIAKVCLTGQIKTIPFIGIIRRRGGASVNFKKTAAVQGIRNTIIINFPFLIREFYFQKIIWNSRQITISDKIDLSLFSIIRYLDKFIHQLVNQNVYNIKTIFKL